MNPPQARGWSTQESYKTLEVGPRVGRSKVLRIPRRPGHRRVFLDFGKERNLLPHLGDSLNPTLLHPEEHHHLHSEAVPVNL